MINYKKFKDEKLKKINQTDRLEILPDGSNWRIYFDNQVLTDNEYIVYYNINNIIYLYHRYNDIIDIIGDLSDLDNPIPQTSIVDAINFVWENGGGEVDTLPTDKITAVDPELEGGETQQIINENVQSVIGDINQLDPNLLSEIDPDNLVNAINYIYLNGGENSDTTNLIYPVNPETEGGDTQQEINENNKAAIDDINNQLDNLSDPDTSTIPTIDPELEGGITQQEVNEANKEAIDDINNQLDNLTDPDTSTIPSVDPELEGGTTQQEINENNKTAIDNINQEIIDINNELPDMSNYYTKSEVDALIEDLQNQINACCGLPATADITNIIPISPTTEDNIDGSINFDVNITGCSKIATASLNPASGTTPITLTDGDNTGLSFSPLPAGDYTIQIYCDDLLVEESDTITIPDYVPVDNGIIDIVTPNDGNLIPPEDADLPTDDGSTFNHPLIFTEGSMVPEGSVQCYQNQIILGDYLNLNEWTTASLNTYNPNDGQGDICYIAIRKTSDTLFDTDRENVSNSITGLNFIKAVNNFELTELVIVGEYGLDDLITLSEAYSNYTYLIAKQYYFTNSGTAQIEQYSYNIIDTTTLSTNGTWLLKRIGNSDTYSSIITFTDTLNASLTSARADDSIITIVGTNSLPSIDLNIVIDGTLITADDYSDATFLLINCVEDTSKASVSQLIYAKDIVYDGVIRYDFNGLGSTYISFNTDFTINIVQNTTHTFTITSIKKIIL